METFCKLFGSLLAFVYHCFYRIVIQGYLPLLTRPEHIVHFFRDAHGIYPITKQALAKRQTSTSGGWRLSRATIAFLWVADVEALQAAADRLSPDIIRKRLDYWTLVLGPKFSQKDRAAIHLRRDYSLHQIEYCRNFAPKAGLGDGSPGRL